MADYKCYKCGYEWKTIVEKPKACPRCKTRLDYVFKEVMNKKEDNIVIQTQEEFESNKRYIPKENY